jgi:arylsulfatase A-like enzyme/tetratricopeptide (TPR) repeat protein
VLSLGTQRALVLAAVATGACGRAPAPEPARPSILLVTLDTTRADAIGPEATEVSTPAFDALAARGRLFRHAYATAPETLPAHSSMMTGLYPAGHGVHENGRRLSGDVPVVAERLRQAGYQTAAFVSAFVLARRFGLARGFEVYDDRQPPGRAERSARETTDAAIAWLAGSTTRPVFLWVHYFDPHHPYEPPEPFRARHPEAPYLGEVEAMDDQLGRLVDAAARYLGRPPAVLAVGDHGEGLGEHGERQHGNLLYQSTMRVPLVLAGPSVAPGASDAPVSTRRVFHTLLDWAGLESSLSLRGTEAEVVLAEAMKPFLAYGWRPQVMAVEGRYKAILAGRPEVYDLARDPAETRDLAGEGKLSQMMSRALRDYPLPSLPAAARPSLGEDERRRLASLGYVSAAAPAPVRPDAPRPVEMAHLFDAIENASGLFVREEYAAAIPLLRKVLAADPANLDAALRLATAHSALGHERDAEAAFARAAQIAPDSPDVRMYRTLHVARGKQWEKAVPGLERIVAETPDRLPALEALAVVRQRQSRIPEAIELRQSIHALRDPTAAELVQLARLAMTVGRTSVAIEAFERARPLQGGAFAHHLELGVLYLAARRYGEARDALDRVPAGHPEYPMALFKRAQVSVLLNEADRHERIAVARRRADASTRPLIESERLFRRP